jgi:hypothetical protein
MTIFRVSPLGIHLGDGISYRTKALNGLIHIAFVTAVRAEVFHQDAISVVAVNLRCNKSLDAYSITWSAIASSQHAPIRGKTGTDSPYDREQARGATQRRASSRTVGLQTIKPASAVSWASHRTLICIKVEASFSADIRQVNVFNRKRGAR